MKRPSKHQADVDLRGRVRRVPAEVDASPPVKAKFIDGPVAGTERLVPRGADYVKVGPWTYSWCGKDGRIPLYAKVPTQRALRRVVHSFIGSHGADPRVAVSTTKRTPAKRTAPPAAGRGARRRAEKRANATA